MATSGLPASVQAAGAEQFVLSFGVNTHIDFLAFGYENLPATEAAIRYLGLLNLRDDPENPADVGAGGWWQQVASATGARFDAFMAEGSVAQMQGDLGRAAALASQGIVAYLEGGNEEDDPYAAANGNSLAAAAAFQRSVAAAAHAAGLPAINMSFGQGWTAANDWAGNYDKVGDLSAWADYANAHTYPQGAPEATIELLKRDALIAAPGDPVIQTEFGYDTDTLDPLAAAKYTLDGLLDSYADGIAKTYLYALYDDGSGAYGLMRPNGSPKPAGLAVHDLVALLADPTAGPGFRPGSLSYALDGAAGDRTALFQKSDGTDWIAVWNEQQGLGASHTATVTLAAPAARITVFDPLTGTAPVAQDAGAASMAFTVPDHPVLLEVVPATATPPPSPVTAPDPSAPPAAPARDAPEASDAAGTVPTQAPDAAPSPAGITLVDVSGGQATSDPLPYSGPVAGIANELLVLTADSLNIAASTPGWFIHSGAGDDAIAAASGRNVLDGGTGSNFLSGGTGTDTFFVDARGAAADTWSTVTGFHAGDTATIWGIAPQGFALGWQDGEGATGYTGLTLHATAPGSPVTSLTLAGYSAADLGNGRLAATFGTDAASGSHFLLITAL